MISQHLLVEDHDAVGLARAPGAGRRGGSRRLAQPCRASRNGVTMSDLTGPGRNSEMSVMRSSKVSGPNLPTSSRWPGDSIWKQPEGAGRADQVGRSPGRRAAPAARRRGRPSTPSTRATSSTAWAIADCIRMPSTSSLSSPRSSTSSLSNWLIGKPSQLASTGVRSSRVRVGQQHPARVQRRCGGAARRAARRGRTCRSSRGAAEPGWPAARAGRAGRAGRRGPGCAGTPWRCASISPGGRPSAAPTSRTACRTR